MYELVLFLNVFHAPVCLQRLKRFLARSPASAWHVMKEHVQHMICLSSYHLSH